jgi:hypothetical protein
MEQGRITPATVADHHPPHDGDWNKFVLDELRSYDFRFESLAAFVKAHQEALKA